MDLKLTHLSYAGSGRPTARVDFDDRLTVIYGASDTGKTFIVETLEYMLGGTSLTMIPEARGYSQILLGIELPNGERATLLRVPGKNTVYLHLSDERELVTRPADAQLTAVHSSRSTHSVSLFLLDQLGLRGARIRTSDSGNTRQLNLRDLVHLSLVTETRMVDPVPPALQSSASRGRTASKSVVKFLLTGEDDPAIATGPSYGQRRVHKGQISLLDQLLQDLQSKLIGQENTTELRARLIRLQDGIDAQTQSLRTLSEQHVSTVADRTSATQVLAELDSRGGEQQDLLNRFLLLADQYESDLARLTMVREAGSLLGYFQVGTCVFCGAEPEHQHAGHRTRETTQLHEAVEAETEKTIGLLHDLLATIQDMEAQLDELDLHRSSVQGSIRALGGEIEALEAQLAPLRTDLDDLLRARSEVERDLELHARIEELQDKRTDLASADAVPSTRPAQLVPTRVLAEFDRVLQETLTHWNVPAVEYAEYDQYSGELRAGGRERAGRGKGVRSVLHSAFTLSLARFCLDHGLPHLGFVVLDSPVVTYREPVGGDITITDHVVDRFYRDLLGFPGQAVIVENGDPPADVLARVHGYAFSGYDSGRYGFFPTLFPG